MRRAVRGAWNGLAALSLLLCAATCALWWRAGTYADTVKHCGEDDRRLVIRTARLAWGPQDGAGDRAVIRVFLNRHPDLADPPGWSLDAEPVAADLSEEPPRVPPRWAMLGVVYWAAEVSAWPDDGRQYGTFHAVVVPFGLTVTSAAAMPCAWLSAAATRRVRQTRRTLTSLCPRCGYDLRASPGRCPECGVEPKRVAA